MIRAVNAALFLRKDSLRAKYGRTWIGPPATARKPVTLACFALIFRPYERSNWHPGPIKCPIIHWQALDFVIDWTAQKRGTPRCEAPAIEGVPFVCCEMP